MPDQFKCALGGDDCEAGGLHTSTAARLAVPWNVQAHCYNSWLNVDARQNADFIAGSQGVATLPAHFHFLAGLRPQ